MCLFFFLKVDLQNPSRSTYPIMDPYRESMHAEMSVARKERKKERRDSNYKEFTENPQ